MKTINNIKIIGVDAGYGNMKTANFCFHTGLTAYDTEPLFTKNMLVYEGHYYLIGEGHKTYTAEKTLDEDYYILTLATIAMELNREHLTFIFPPDCPSAGCWSRRTIILPTC